MVSIWTIISILISAVICFAVPIWGIFFLKRRGNNVLLAVAAGALSFFIFQFVIRIPILQLVLPNMEFYQKLSANPLGISIFLGFTAALFETVGRLVFMKLMLRGKESYITGIAHGVGHGGVEAVLLVGINYITFIVFSILINTGNFDGIFLGTAAPAYDQMSALKVTLIGTNSFMFLVAGIERFLTMIIHVGFSLLIMEGLYKKRLLPYFLIVLGLHALLDFLAVYLGLNGVSVLLIELVVVAFAAVSGFYIIKRARKQA